MGRVYCVKKKLSLGQKLINRSRYALESGDAA